MNVDRAAEIGIAVDPIRSRQNANSCARRPLEARWIVAELHATAGKVNYAVDGRTTASTTRPTSSISSSGAASAIGIWKSSSYA
jgi:hypothetical protein